MSAPSTAGYQSIGEGGSVYQNGSGKDSGTAQANMPGAVKDRLQAVARGASDAAHGARHAVGELIRSPMPEVNVYVEPLNPSSPFTLQQRVELVIQSCRGWGEFADLRALNFPPVSEMKLRMGHNVETFFYNYLVVAVASLLVVGLFHPFRALLVAGTVLLATLFYVVHPDPFTVGDKEIAQWVKHVVMASILVLVVFFGHVLSLVFWIAVFATSLVALHSFFRDHAVPTTVSSI